MKHQFITTLFAACSCVALAQNDAFNVLPAGTMIEYRESFEMVPFWANTDGFWNPAELAMGGFDGTTVTASVEIGFEDLDGNGPSYWVGTEPMGQARMDFQAETFSMYESATVWVFGGFDGDFTLASTEAFLADEETWLPGPDMLSPRTNHRSIRLNSNQVLITGGFDGQEETASCEVFDLTTQTFTAVASMNVGRASHTLSSLGDGRVLVTGGFNAAAGFQLSSCEVYDPETDVWTEVEPLPVAVDNHAATLIALTGQSPDVVVVTGGRTFNPDLNLFEGESTGAMLDVATLSWVPFDLASPHSYHQTAHLDGASPELFVMGGADQTGSGVETTYGQTEWLLGTETQEWSAPAITQNRHRAAGCRTGTGMTQCYTVCGGDAAMEGTCFTVCPETSGVDDLEGRDAGVLLYPNPVVGQSALWTSDQAHLQGWTLMDASGKLVLEGKGPSLDGAQLSPGMHVLNIPGHAPLKVMIR